MSDHRIGFNQHIVPSVPSVPTNDAQGITTSRRFVPPRLVKRSQNRDTFQRYVTDSPSPETFASWLRAVDGGDVAALCELQEGMEAKDAWLQGVASTRRGAVTALEWDIVDNEDGGDDSKSSAIATYVRKKLRELGSFDAFLIFMQSAVGPNVAVTELVWHRGNLIDLVPVPCHRLTESPFERGVIAVETDEFPLGIPTNFSEPAISKFVVYHPDGGGWFPLRKTMTHATVWPYLVQHFSRTDWMAFSELYGTPIRTAEYDDSVVDADRDTVFEMLENMGSDTAAAIPIGVKVALLQATGTGETFESQMAWAQSQMSVLWLGQTLTTDVGDKGSFAAAKVHDNVRADMLLHDLNAERCMVDEQVIKPMVRLRFPDWRGSVPTFKRLLNERKDIEATRLRIDQLRLAREMGLPVKADEAYEALGFARPEGFEADTVGGTPEVEGDEPDSNTD